MLWIRGSLSNPVFSGSIGVEQGRLLLDSQTLPLTHIKLRLDMKDNLMILHELKFNIEEGEVIGKGALPLPFLKLPIGNLPAQPRDQVYQGDLTIAHCPVAILQTFLAGKFPQNTTGDISGVIHLKGKNPDLSDLACTATITLDDLNINGLPFYLAEPIKIISNQDGIVMPEVVLKGRDDLRLAMKGSYDLQKEKPLDFSMKGKLDSQVLFGFFPELAGAGMIVFELDLGGTIKDMEWNGKIEAVNNDLQFAAGNLFITQLNGIARMDNQTITIERLAGSLNGGTIEVKGRIGQENKKQPAADLQLKFAGINLNFPKGLFTNLSGQLNLLSDDKEYLLKGNMDMNGGKYNESFNVGSYLYEFLFNPKETIIESGDNDLKKRVKLNINLQTAQALVVDNNVCRSELNAELTLGGTYFQPNLSGRIYVKEGGNIYFGSRIFSIEKGQINFINPNFIEPDFNIDSSTQIGIYDIKLALRGTPRNFIASFSSLPPLAEQNIVSLLATGKGPDDLSGSVLYETGSTALNYIGYAVTGKLQELIKKNLGLQSFRIDGSLLSAKEDPGAKITIAKNITPKLELTYSQGLRQTQNPTWMLNYKPAKSLNIQGIQSDSDLYTLGVQYQLSFHSARETAPAAADNVKKSKPLLIDNIQIDGEPVLTLPVIMKQIKQKPGRVFSFIQFQEDSEQLRSLYRENDFLSAQISAEYYPNEGKVTLIYRILAGAKVFLSFPGEGINRSVRKKCAERWMEGQFDGARANNVISELTQFFRKKYYQAQVLSIRLPKIISCFIFFHKQGNESPISMILQEIARSRYNKILRAKSKNLRMDVQLFSDPDQSEEKLENYYENKGTF